MKRELLRVEYLKKGNVLKWIQLQVFENEIIHCVFDNVQEKHMLLDVMSGKRRADFVKLYFFEWQIPEKEIPQVLEENVAVISNESELIHSVSILENLFLIRSQVKGQWVRHKAYHDRAAEVFREFDIALDMNLPTEKLGMFEKVQIEFLRAYLLEKKIVLCTGLGNALSDTEATTLWGLIEKFRQRGISVIMAEPLEDLSFAHTDRVIVIKHGKTWAVKDIGECDYTMLYTILYQNTASGSKQGCLSVDGDAGGCSAMHPIHMDCLKDISLTVHKGEIVKLFCVDEKSYHQVTAALRGRIGVLEGNPVSASLFMQLTAMNNLQILLSRKVNGIWMYPRYKKSIRLQLKGILSDAIYQKRMTALTPQEVQKIAYCRWLVYSPELLVCIQPFADGNIQARKTAREMIYILKKRGIGILIVTTNTLGFYYCRGREAFMRNGKMISKEEAYHLFHP